MTEPASHNSPGRAARQAPPAYKGRVWLRAGVLLILVSVALYLLAFRSFLTRRFVESRLEAGLGGLVQTRSVRIEPFASPCRVVIDGLLVRAIGLDGDASEVARAEHIDVRLDLLSCLGPSPVVHSVRLDQPVLRISQSLENGTINLAGLSVKGAGQGTQLGAVPEFYVDEGRIELGEHEYRTGGAYTLLKSFRVAGRVEQSADDKGASIVSFREVSSDTNAAGVVVRGRLSREEVTLTMGALDLGSVESTSIPTPARRLYADAALEGRIDEAEVTYRFTGEWTARFLLRSVALNLPVRTQPDEDQDGNPIPVPPDHAQRRMRMLNTNGELVISNSGVTGSLVGVIEELPYEVAFKVDGVQPASPWTCTLTTRNFRLEQQPQVLRFAPGLVRRRLREFSDPTGLLDARVTVSSAGGKLEQENIRVNGSLVLRDVTAAFHRFPYRFRKMQGEVEFDEKKVILKNIRGVADSGATILAEGKIEPPSGDNAGFDLDVAVSRLPIDSMLRDALRARGQDAVIDALIDPDAYATLVNQGLLRPDRPMAGLTSRIDAPVFDMGGMLDVHVRVHRDIGADAEWEDVVVIDFPDVGLLPSAFPYPLRARGVRVVQENGVARVSGGELLGIGGGVADATALVDFARLRRAGADFAPDMELRARAVPLDPLLWFAARRVGRGETPGKVVAMLEALGVSGKVDASVSLRVDEHDELRYEADFSPLGASAQPPGAQRGTRFEQVTGQVRVNNLGVEVDVTGVAVGAGVSGQASVMVRRDTPHSGPDAPPLATLVEVSSERMPLAIEAEELVRPLAPGAADWLQAARAEHRPVGEVAMGVIVNIPDRARASVRARVRPLSTVQLRWQGDLFELSQPSGFVEVAVSSEGQSEEDALRSVVGFRDFSCGIGAQGRVDAAVKVSGDVAPTRDPSHVATELEVRSSGARIDGAVATLLNRFGAGSTVDVMQRHGISATVDADLRVRREQGEPGAIVTGLVRPREARIVVNDEITIVPGVAGEIELTPRGGVVRALALSSAGWDIFADGAWTRSSAAASIDGLISLTATSLTPDLLGLLPEALRGAMTDLKTSVDGPIAMMQTPLRVVFDSSGRVSSISTSGQVRVEQASCDIGVRVSDASGTLDFRYERAPGDASGVFTLAGNVESCVAGGVSMTHGDFTLEATPKGEVIAPEFTARVHGGRLTGAARLGVESLPPDFVGPPLPGRPFDIVVETSNVRLASLIEDLKPDDVSGPGLLLGAEPAADASRGLLSGSFTLSGNTAFVSTRRGRGTFTARGGRVLSLPTLVPLVKVTNLQLPSQEPLDYALADFYLQGGVLSFEQVSVSSASVGLYGYGTATWPGLVLDMRFRAGNRTRIPILTPLMESIRGELLTAVVQGPVHNPDVSTSSFTNTKRTLSDIFGRERSEQDRRMDLIERQVSPSQRRDRRDDAPPLNPVEVSQGE